MEKKIIMQKNKIFDKIIKFKKPITIEKFTDLCLYSKSGYYTNANVIGRSGDFTTAPEISQLFGEIIGLYIYDFWQNKINKPFNLIELGPGNGTLLMDVLRINNKFNKFRENINIELIEKNINLISKQKNYLIKNKLEINKIVWSNNFDPTNLMPTIIIANEFFDCFPVRQFIKKKKKWFEKMVYFNKKECQLKFKDYEVKDNKTIKKININNSSSILEISPLREKYFLKICKHIKKVGGMMMIIDYGYLEKTDFFTLQSLFNNKPSNVLDNLGSQDITALVDYSPLIKLSKICKLKIDTYTSQCNFLVRYGINERAKKILLNCNNTDKKIIKDGLQRLIDKNNMGSIFKVLIISK